MDLDGNVYKMKTNRSRKRNWTDDEIKILIQLWSERQVEFMRTKRNSGINEAISSDLEIYGFFRDGKEIHMKIKNLTQHYRKEATAQGMSGGSPSTWKYFNEVGAILGFLPSNAGNLVRESILIENENSDDLFLQPSIPSSQSSFLIRLKRAREESTSREESTPQQSTNREDSSAHITATPRQSTSREDSLPHITATPRQSTSKEDSSPHITATPRVSDYLQSRNKEKQKKRKKNDMMEEMMELIRKTGQSVQDTDDLMLQLFKENNDLLRKQNDILEKIVEK